MTEGDKEEAKLALQKIVSAISMSLLASERHSSRLPVRPRVKLEQINDDEFVSGKKKYLLANDKTQIQQACLNIKADNLGAPQVSFKKKHQGYTFSMWAAGR